MCVDFAGRIVVGNTNTQAQYYSDYEEKLMVTEITGASMPQKCNTNMYICMYVGVWLERLDSSAHVCMYMQIK